MQQQAGPAGTLGGELQAARGERVEGIELADHGGQVGAAQRLLDRPEAVGGAVRPDQQQPLGRDARGRGGRGVEIAELGDPEQAARPRGQQAHRQGQAEAGRRPVVPLGALRQDLVQPGQGEAAAGQRLVELGRAERQRLPCRGRAAALDPADPLAQGVEPSQSDRLQGHEFRPGRSDVPFMF